MNTDKLTQLLEAFYDGTTTIEEEQELYQYFTSADVPEELEAEKRVFLGLYNLSADDDIEVPSSLSNKLSSLIDDLSEKEKPKRRSIMIRRVSAIAASLLLLISVGLFILNDRHPHSVLADTYTDPEEAYIETQKTLQLISSTLNDGMKPLKQASDDIIMVNQIVNESFSKIR